VCDDVNKAIVELLGAVSRWVDRKTGDRCPACSLPVAHGTERCPKCNTEIPYTNCMHRKKT